MWTAIIRWITGDLVGQLTHAYEVKKRADTDEKKLVADAAIKSIEARMAAKAEATGIRKATAGFIEMRLMTFLIAFPFALHSAAVGIDTTFGLGWGVAAYPPPFDEWEGRILLSFFGVQVAGQGINAIAAAIRGRR